MHKYITALVLTALTTGCAYETSMIVVNPSDSFMEEDTGDMFGGEGAGGTCAFPVPSYSGSIAVMNAYPVVRSNMVHDEDHLVPAEFTRVASFTFANWANDERCPDMTMGNYTFTTTYSDWDNTNWRPSDMVIVDTSTGENHYSPNGLGTNVDDVYNSFEDRIVFAPGEERILDVMMDLTGASEGDRVAVTYTKADFSDNTDVVTVIAATSYGIMEIVTE